MPDVISRTDARSIQASRYFTGKPCGYGHVDERYVSNGKCIPCALKHSFDQIRSDAGKRVNRKSKLKNIYMLSEEDFNLLLESQKFRCACCGLEFNDIDTPNVDHDHSDGRVRGLLCRKCNLNVARFDHPLRATYIAYVDQGGFL